MELIGKDNKTAILSTNVQEGREQLQHDGRRQDTKKGLKISRQEISQMKYSLDG